MATKNRRVAAYLPPEVDKAFIEFKIERDFASEDNPNQNDSKALIQLLSEFLGVSYSAAHPSGSDVLKRLSDLEGQVAHLKFQMSSVASTQEEVRGELLSELKNELVNVVPGQLSFLDDDLAKPSSSSFPEALGLTALSKRLGKSSGTLSRYKDDPEKLAEWTRSQDPDGVAWTYKVKDKKFYPS